MRQKISVLVGLLFVLPGLVAAQTPSPGSLATPIQQAPQMLNACSTTNGTAAVNTTTSATATPPNGQYVYVCGLDVTISFDATGGTASTNVSFTSSNLNSWAWKTSWAGTASTTIYQPFYFANPIKAQNSGTAVTITSPAGNTHGAYNINLYYFFAP